ncbi:MAG: hypothetical protein RLZZ338_159 [Cyanobacteriota bacterium]|jgi:formylglycine-generating enzyme required for sulfatase activity
MINRLITALSQELELSAKEIADTIWLALQMDQFSAEDIDPQPPLKKGELEQPPLKQGDLEQPLKRGELEQPPLKKGDSEKRTTKQSQQEQKAGIYPRNDSSKSSGLSIRVPDASSLREPLMLARALKPLMRRVTSGRELVLDEVATIQQIADQGLWIPILKPTLEPWLDLDLVVDESISMQIWRHTIKELERLLKNYGIFRDVRVWGLMIDDNQQVKIRRGIGASSKHQSPRSPKELIDPSGRRLVLVVSDCVSSLWRSGKVTPVLEMWAKQGLMAIIQMLPKWMWKRTALGWATEVWLRALSPGVFNQNLIAQEVYLSWDEVEEERVVKVPVFTLERDRAEIWAQMLAGKGSIWASGYLFKLENANRKESGLFNFTGDWSAENRVQGFRVTASPMARKLAGLLASAPVITLPIVRLIQESFLKDSLQVNVAEVFLGGLLKPLSEINAETNPDQVQYDFMDGVRELLLDSVPSDYVLNVIDEVSKYVAKKLGLSVADFAAVLKKEQPVINSEMAEEVGYFATVKAQVLRRLGGEYAKFAEELDRPIKLPLNFLWQEGNTNIYSLCTDEPWTLPFDALVIPTSYIIFGAGFAKAFKDFLSEESFSILITSINQAKDENKLSVISPESPLLVSLPSEIKSQFPQIDIAQSNQFLIFTTVESLQPNVHNAFKAIQGLIWKIENQGINRVVLPLLGTGNNGLPITKVAIAMLSALTESLNKLSSNSIKEIIFVDKNESTIDIINKVAHNLFSQKEIDDVQLLSVQGIDYTQLRDLLAAGKWEEADEETARLMFKVADREEEEELRIEDIENFSYTDLQTIDQLWVKYSNGHFGFSVQKKIWQELGEQVNIETERKLGERLGWFDSDEWWLDYDDYTFSLDAPKGHLPASWDCWGIDGYEVHSTCLLLSRLLDSVKNKQVDYTQLGNLLAEDKWKEADEETARLMLKIADREREGWLRVEDIEQFPSRDLQTIDQLWVEYSNGRFGFSVQKQIYQSLGGTKEFNQKITEAFWHKVGLIINNQHYWSQYDNLIFNLSAPIGHLPIRYDVNTPAGVIGIVEGLLSRPDLVLPEVKNKQSETLQTYQFETVTVNRKGKIIKTETKKAQYFLEKLPNNVLLEMVAIPGGEFMMGSPEGEGNDWEKPQHKVTVKPFFIGKYPVTQAQWQAVANLPKLNRNLNPDPSHFKGDNRPVENVNWYDAVEFCDRLSTYTQRQYRLPFEAEWEYACRAGTTTPFNLGETLTPELATYGSSRSKWNTIDYNYKDPISRPIFFNGFGLFDMHGTIWEWCADNWRNNYENVPTVLMRGNFQQKSFQSRFVVRGGSWGKPLEYCYSAYRQSEDSDYKSDFNGFRVVCNLEIKLT